MYQPMNRMTGFSLIEVLVAMLVLAVGLLGLAALQIAGVQSNQKAYYRSIATQLAYDMADRMRANPVGVTDGAYNQGTPGSSLTQCESGSCTPDVLAGYDLMQWNSALAAKLPGGTGIVCSITSVPTIGDSKSQAAGCAYAAGSVAGNTYAVYVWWNDDRKGSTTQGFVTSFQVGN